MASIYLIVGPPAVGKSTTSRALAAGFDRSIHIPLDDLRHMVVSGQVVPGRDWTDELIQQITLARESAIDMALKYSRAGFSVVLDDILDLHGIREYQVLAGHLEVRRVVLWPEQNEAHRRNLQREGVSPSRDYLDDGIRFVYQNLRPLVDQLKEDGWMVLDNSTLTVEASVIRILHGTGT